MIKACIFDIESSALEAVGAGFMLCASVKPYLGNVKTFRYDQLGCPPAKETTLIRELLKELAKYDLWIAHNGRKFDWNFIKSRAKVLGVEIMFNPNPLLYDTLEGFRHAGFLTRQNGFGRPTAALDFCIDAFGIKQRKTKIYPREHWKAVWESERERKAAMQNIVDHCEADVIMTEQFYEQVLRMDYAPAIKRIR